MLTATRTRAAAVTGNPRATQAALDTLRRGGNALDAAVSAAFVLTVVEPQHAGLAGSGVLVWVPLTGSPAVVTGRASAPAGLAPGTDVWAGGARIGVPALVPALVLASECFGALPWPELVAPAAAAARDGYLVGAHLGWSWAQLAPVDRARLAPALGDLAPATVARAPGAARALDEVARHGAAALAAGWLADDLLAGVAAAGGTMTAGDLAATAAVTPAALAYARDWLVIGPGWPAWGTPAVAEALGALADAPQDAGRPAATVDVLHRAYVRHGVFRAGPKRPADAASTSHLAVRDGEGNLVSLTLSVGSPFGTRRATPQAGLVLNDELTDFDHVPSPAGAGARPAENRPAPGAAPRSSMTPLVLVHGDGTRLAVGGAGGKQIVAAVTGVLDALVWRGASPQAAVDAPRVFVPVRPTQPIRVEPGLGGAARAALAAGGTPVVEADGRWSCVNVLRVAPAGDAVEAGVDHRRDCGAGTWP